MKYEYVSLVACEDTVETLEQDLNRCLRDLERGGYDLFAQTQSSVIHGEGLMLTVVTLTGRKRKA